MLGHGLTSGSKDSLSADSNCKAVVIQAALDEAVSQAQYFSQQHTGVSEMGLYLILKHVLFPMPRAFVRV